MTDFKFTPAMLAQHLAIVGRTGSGKSYAAKGAVEALLTANRRVCILDPTGIWYGLRSSADGKKPGFPVVVFGGQHADVQINERAGAAVAKILATQNLPAIIDLSELLIGQRHQFVTDFAETLYRDNRTPLHLVIDEADEFCPQNPLPETKRMLHHVDRIVRRGRVRGFRVMLITQRPAVLHKNVLTQANALIAMRLTGPQDREAMKAWVDGQGDPQAGKIVLDSLAQLKMGEGWVWAPEEALLERVKFPRIKTFDSGRTPGDDEVIAPPTKLAAVDISGIQSAFDAIKLEPTVAELQAELAKLRRAAPTQVGHTDAQVQALVTAAMNEARDAERLYWRNALCGMLDKSPPQIAPPPTHFPKANAAAVVAASRLSPLFAKTTNRAADLEPPSGLRSGAIRILQQLAARAPAGYSRPQVGALTQFSHKGGTFGTYFSDLRRGGFIEERDGLVYATEAGIRRLGADVPAAPTSHLEAMTQWRKALRSGAFAMLEAVCEAGDRGLDRGMLAAAVSMQATGGTFGTYLSDLRRNGLITERDKRLYASAVLYPSRVAA